MFAKFEIVVNGDLDYETGGYKSVTATITYDWAYRKDDEDDASI